MSRISVPRAIVAVAVAAAFLAAAGAVAAQEPPDPAEFTPEGYTFCGWRDPGSQTGWAMEWDERLVGAYSTAFARNMTCRAARRNIARMRYTQRPPYRPVRPGYRCTTLGSDWEYSDVRCAKRGRPSVAFRARSGA